MTVGLRARCADARTARALRDAVRADTPGFVRLEVRGPLLEIRLRPATAASARATVDDLLACLKAAERSVEVDAPSARARRRAAR